VRCLRPAVVIRLFASSWTCGAGWHPADRLSIGPQPDQRDPPNNPPVTIQLLFAL
jgi:hypothetical protein